MIPVFLYRDGAPFGVLLPGVHNASLAEVEKRFATNRHRKALFKGIVAVAKALKAAGCRRMFLDGSYVTSKEQPDDFDGCWDPVGVIASNLDPVLLDFHNSRAAQKQKYGGEMFIATWPATAIGSAAFFDFFQLDKHTGKPKGIIAIELDQKK